MSTPSQGRRSPMPMAITLKRHGSESPLGLSLPQEALVSPVLYCFDKPLKLQHQAEASEKNEILGDPGYARQNGSCSV